MIEDINFNWSKKLEITNKEIDPNLVIETFSPDKLNRQKYAKFLTKFLASEGNDSVEDIKSNYVLNLNSEWGSGKSYFLRRWAYDIKPYFPVVYIDAWKQDYSDDPLMTVVSSMIKQLKEQSGSGNDDVFKAPTKLISLLKAAAPSLARGLAKRYLGIDPSKLIDLDEGTQGENASDENGKPIDMSLAASKIVEQVINEHDAKSKAIDNLKISVEKWIEQVVKSEGRKYPAFIFIDELDRCRPSYAVEMLETIKHIFDIPGVVFVVATDTGQLQHAVKAIYGNGFDARVYLARFFNSRFTLKKPNLENLLEVHCNVKKLSKECHDKQDIKVWPINREYTSTLDNITTVLNIFNLSPRSAIQVTERIIATISNLPPNTVVDIIMLTVLLCIKDKDESLYEDILSDNFERTIKDKKIGLSDYLIDVYNIKDDYIKVNIDPLDYSSSFQSSQLKRHKKGEYLASFYTYLSDVFCNYFGGKTTFFNVFGDNSGRQLTPLQDIEQRLYTLSFNDVQQFSGDNANLWIKYSNLDLALNETPIDFYRDLVELASAIDWIDDD